MLFLMKKYSACKFHHDLDTWIVIYCLIRVAPNGFSACFVCALFGVCLIRVTPKGFSGCGICTLPGVCLIRVTPNWFSCCSVCALLVYVCLG